MKLLLLLLFTLISSYSFGQSITGKWIAIDSSVTLEIRKKRIGFEIFHNNENRQKEFFRYKRKSNNRLKIMDDYLTAGMFFGLTQNKLACFKIDWLSENKFKLSWISEKKSSEYLRDMLFRSNLTFHRR